MAAPQTTARAAPAGARLPDGYQTLYAFERAPTLSVWEKSVKPPGIDGGDAIDITTMHNLDFRTMAARALKTLTQSTFKGAYDPNAINQLMELINASGSITVHYPDGSTLSFFGFLKSVEFDDLVEGTMPEGTFTVVPTNYDPVNHVEAAPVLTSVSGT